MNLPAYQVDRIDADAFAKIAHGYGIYYTIHLDENLNLCDFNEKAANACLYTVLQTVEHAKQMHIPVLNMHLSNPLRVNTRITPKKGLAWSLGC